MSPRAVQSDMFYAAEKVDLANGKKRLQEAIRGLLRPGLQRIADVVAGHARDNVAIDSGLLKSTIKGRVRKKRGADELTATVSSNTKGKQKTYRPKRKWKLKDGTIKTGLGKERTITVKYGYGLDQEIGHNAGPDSSPYTFKPYLRPALQQSHEEIKQILQEEYARQAAASKASAAPAASYVNADIPIFGREILTGKKGGKYYINDNGKKTYVK